MSFPTTIYSHATLVDLVDSVLAAHQNTPNLELTTLETWILDKAELGWLPVNETWTYASATTITVPTDATTKYIKGDRVRFKQGAGYKYVYIQSLTSTVLTVNGGTDFTVANAAITDVYISRASLPLGFPQSFNFSPTWTNLSVGNGTVTAKFRIIAGQVFYNIELVFGSTTSISGAVEHTFPIECLAHGGVGGGSAVPIGLVRLLAPGGAFQGIVQTYSPWTKGNPVAQNSAGTYLLSTQLSSTIPGTWTTANEMMIRGNYPMA